MRQIISVIPIFLLVYIFSGCYYTKQGSYALRYQFSAQSNKKLLSGRATPDSVVKLLTAVEKIRAYAFDSLGLKKNGNYSCYTKIDKPYLYDNVYAAHPDTFSQYFWKYPIFGPMPYKGFFERKDAEKEAEKLRRKGYDVLIGKLNGYSSLGIVNDPVFSFMSHYGPWSLANYILHEMTHSTIFSKKHTQFNEEVATFIGTEGALRYVAVTLGDTSAAYQRALLVITDYGMYRKIMNDLYRDLDAAYRTLPSREERLAAKDTIISQFRRTFTEQYDSRFKTKMYTDIPQSTINNASVMIHATYSHDHELYQQLLNACGNDFNKMVAVLLQNSRTKGNPKTNLKKWMEKSKAVDRNQ